MSESARVILEVQAGVTPGIPEPELSRQWVLTTAQWESAMATGKQSSVLAEFNGRAQGYAAMLMLKPHAVNWVRTEWLWA